MTNSLPSNETVFDINHGYRFQWEKAQDCYVLLYPEGMVKLNGSAGEILAFVDGKRNLADIIHCLEEKFPQAEGLAQDVIVFMGDAHEKRWIKQA